MFIIQNQLSNYEIEKILKELSIYRNKISVQAGVGGSYTTTDVNVRRGKTAHPKPDQAFYTFNILQSIIYEEYNKIYKFLFTDISEVQYAYYGKGDFFKRHRDTIFNTKKVRCLTFSMNLSNEDDYKGGELVIYDPKNNNNEIILNKKKGSYVIFPSFYLHEAKEVLEGEREAMVCWLTEDVKTFNSFKNYVDLK